MTKECKHCRFHRDFLRPLSHRLQAELSAGEAQLIEALTRMSQDDAQRRDAETSQLRQLWRQEESEWGTRPEMTSYCGLHEARHVFYVPELKNPRHDCEHFEARRPEPRRECATCRHRVPARGPAEDQAQFADVKRMAGTAIAVNDPHSMGPFDELRNWIATVKVCEATQAFHDRELSQQPRYLSTCAKRSSPLRFVPCAVGNPHDACADWSSAGTAATASPAQGWSLLGAAAKRANP